MTEQAPDGHLVAEYTFNGSESAFDALVHRHARMVYATAVRQLGESGLAEEVTQNTFLALARKAPRLHGDQTLAGWLHRTALLEAKARIRKELRRRRREETAASLATSDREGDSAVAPLVPLLDEALLDLRDLDRQALVLRFLEGSSLRDVGRALGVDEDAARKRVSRALDRVGEFFRQRGFAVPAATVTALLAEQSAFAMPVGLAGATAQAALSSAVASPSFSVAGIQFMALTKTQTAVVTLLAVSVPLAWQWGLQADVQKDQAAIQAQTVQALAHLQSLEAQFDQERESILRIQTEQANAEIRLAQRRAQLEKREPPPVYQWNDFEPLARVPKRLLTGLSLSSVSDKAGALNQQMINVLQLTDAETRQTQEVMHGFLKRYQTHQGEVMRQIEPLPSDLNERPPEEVRAFEMTHDPEAFDVLRQDLFADLHEVLGAERAELFKRGLDDWMPLDDDYQGVNSGMAMVNADHRYVFYQPEPGADGLAWGLKVEGRGSVHMTSDLTRLRAWLPDHLRHALEDWIDLAEPKPEVLAP